MSADVAAVIDAAADLLERDGWCQGTGVVRDGRRSVVVALAHAAGGRAPAIIFAAYAAVRRQVGTELITWNNQPDLTVDQVVAVLRATAGRERITG